MPPHPSSIVSVYRKSKMGNTATGYPAPVHDYAVDRVARDTGVNPTPGAEEGNRISWTISRQPTVTPSMESAARVGAGLSPEPVLGSAFGRSRGAKTGMTAWGMVRISVDRMAFDQAG